MVADSLGVTWPLTHASAWCFGISTALLTFAAAMKPPVTDNGDIGSYGALDPAFLLSLWVGRREAQTFELLGALFACIAWLTALPAIDAFASACGGPTRAATGLLTSVWKLAAALSIMEFTAEAGTASASDWISTWPSVQDTNHTHDGGFGPIQALEISYVMTHSRTLCAPPDLARPSGHPYSSHPPRPPPRPSPRPAALTHARASQGSSRSTASCWAPASPPPPRWSSRRTESPTRAAPSPEAGRSSASSAPSSASSDSSSTSAASPRGESSRQHPASTSSSSTSSCSRRGSSGWRKGSAAFGSRAASPSSCSTARGTPDRGRTRSQ